MSTTLQNVIDRITLDYLNRTDLNNEAVRAVQAAIRQYERQRFPWNETTTTLTASATSPILALPDDFLIVDLLEVQFQSSTYALTRRTHEFIRQVNAAAGGNSLPVHFCERGYTFEVAPVPDSAYLLNCHYLQQLPALTAMSMSSSNKWLSAAEDLIVYHATKLLWANVLRNPDEAARYFQLEQSAYSDLRRYTGQRVTFGIRPTRF